MNIVLPDPGPPNPMFERPADRPRLERTAKALWDRGFAVEIADSAPHARSLVLAAIPEGSEVHSALSETMDELGITQEIDESGRYDSVRVRQEARRRLVEYVLPREFVRMQGLGYPGSLIGKTLTLEADAAGRITVILVPERLGF
jgi:hypothetical protein